VSKNCLVEQILTGHPYLKPIRKRIRFLLKRRTYRSIIKQSTSQGASRNTIRKQQAAAYTWLFRWDKEWLYEHLPESFIS